MDSSLTRLGSHTVCLAALVVHEYLLSAALLYTAVLFITSINRNYVVLRPLMKAALLAWLLHGLETLPVYTVVSVTPDLFCKPLK